MTVVSGQRFSGESIIFADGSHSAVAYTDNAGNAHVDGIRWSDTPGIAAIRITASKGNDHAGLLLEQTLISSGANPTATPAESVRSTPLPPPSPAAVETSPSVRSEQAAVSLTTPAVSVESFGRKPEAPPIPSFNRSISANPLKTEIEPSVSIVSSSQEKFSSGSKKKWIILGIAIAAGAGAGFVFANRSSKSSSTTATTSSISFGSPTVSVGHP